LKLRKTLREQGEYEDEIKEGLFKDLGDKYSAKIDTDLEKIKGDFLANEKAVIEKKQKAIAEKQKKKDDRELMKKQKKLEKLSRQNHFLETIKDDYENYHNYIVEQKEGQIRAMNSIKQYVEDLIVSGKLTDQDIRQAKDDQREITSEVKKIREKINEIIGV
jgi:hypothetical protein